MKVLAAMSSNKPVILITGGAGFLDSNMSAAYLAKGYKVLCVDNLSTCARENIAHLENNPDFTFIEHDICEPLPASITSGDIAIIANMASPASIPGYTRLALETLAVGSVGVVNMLELAKAKKARFFQASTSEVYGEPEVNPQPESYRGSVNSYGPRSMYDEAKRFAEATIYSYRRKYDINTVIARFFNTYGPGMDPDDGRVVSNFIVQALRGEPLTVYGDGKQTRSFCYVDDLVKVIMLLIDSNEEGPMNLGNPGEFTILELAEIVQELTGTKQEIVHKVLPGDDPTQRRPDITHATKTLGWKPTISLRDGLVPTIEYFKTKV